VSREEIVLRWVLAYGEISRTEFDAKLKEIKDGKKEKENPEGPPFPAEGG